MDYEIEEKIVNKFVIKDKKERAIHELRSSKKRDRIIQRLDIWLDEKYELLCDNKIEDEDLDKFIRRYIKNPKECYVIEDGSLDGKKVSYEVAFEKFAKSDGAIFVLCGENLLVAKAEFHYERAYRQVYYHE